MSAETVSFETTNMNDGVVSSADVQTLSPVAARFPQKLFIFFPDIKFDRFIFRLNRPIELALEAVQGGWICEDKRFALSGFGKTSAAAICSIFEDFTVLWKEIAQAPDEELSEEAQSTKHDLLGLVKSVEEND